MYMVDSSSNQVAAYTYDPYGKILSATGAMADVNPLRYRGYYYDSETGFYYLQSRYYDPNTCRFINADSYASTGQGFLGYNMFAYCGNNPMDRVDTKGAFWDVVIDIVSLLYGIVDVKDNWEDPWAWTGLVGDVADIAIPFVAGIGESVRFTKFAKKIDAIIENSKLPIKSFGEIDTRRWGHIITKEHAWDRVLDDVTQDNVEDLIYEALEKGEWTFKNDYIFTVTYKYHGETIEVRGRFIDGILNISDAMVRTR